MRLKNILLVVSDITQSKRFYHELFGVQIVRDFGENVILSEGLVLQGAKRPVDVCSAPTGVERRPNKLGTVEIEHRRWSIDAY